MNTISSSALSLIPDLVLSVPPWFGIPAVIICIALTQTKRITELLRVWLNHRLKLRELNLALSTKDLSPKQAKRVQETLKAMRSPTPSKEP